MIDDDVLAGRMPRLGSITTGYGVEATSRAGNSYAQPTRSDTLVMHTDDVEIAEAAKARFGGEIREDSPNWTFDVVTATREIELLIMPSGWRQNLEKWRTADCLRRCDGITMSIESGRPCTKPCVCDHEMKTQGAERACVPSTVLPGLMDLDVDRFGVWEIRSNGWGSASNLKGTMRALAMVGIHSGAVPARLAMVDRKVRDGNDQVHDIVELTLTVAQSHRSLQELAGSASAAIGAPGLVQLPAGSEGDRLRLMQQWSDLQSRSHRLGLRNTLLDQWRDRFGQGRQIGDLSIEELSSWVDHVDSEVRSTEDILRREREEAQQ